MKLTIARRLAMLIKDEQLSEIRSVLEPFSLEERRHIVSKKIQDRTSLLLAAVKQKEITIVNYLIDQCGAIVKEAGPCLSMAANNQCPQLVKLLFNNGSDINGVDSEQRSALYYACVNGDMSLVEYLVKNGAHIDDADIEGNTPLMVCVNFPNICRYLLINSAHPNRVNVHGKTALMLATEQEISLYSVHVLLAFQADINFTNEFGENAVFLAAQNGLLHVIDLLESFGAETTKSLAKSHQVHSIYASMNNNEIIAANYWRMSANLLELSTTSIAYEMEGLSVGESNFQPILKYLTNEAALLYLERHFGPQNPYTLRAIGVAICHTEDIHDCVPLFTFLLRTLKTTNNSTYFRIIPCIQAVCTWILWVLKSHHTDETVQIVKQILEPYTEHVKDVGDRFRRLSNTDRNSKSMTIDSYFSVILSFLRTVHNVRPDQLSALNESIKQILSEDLRGSGYNSLLHFCVKNGYPVDVCKALLSCGADVRSQNQQALTPVHYTMEWPHYKHTDTIQLFLTREFDLEAWNCCGECCLGCNLKRLRLLPRPANNTTLQCLAAKVVSGNELRYKDEVPRHLQSMVYSHFF